MDSITIIVICVSVNTFPVTTSPCRCVFTISCKQSLIFFFFQAEDGIRDTSVTGVQTCALPIYLGRLDLMEGNLDSALRNLTLAASKPPFPDVAYYLGYAYLKKGNFDSAEKWLEKAAALAPRDARVEQRLGLLYRAMGRQEESEKAFARSSELHKQDVVATEQALACGRSLDTQPLAEARQACQKLLDPDDVAKLVSLGVLYGQHGDYAEALEPFRLAAEADPDHYEMQYNH